MCPPEGITIFGTSLISHDFIFYSRDIFLFSYRRTKNPVAKNVFGSNLMRLVYNIMTTRTVCCCYTRIQQYHDVVYNNITMYYTRTCRPIERSYSNNRSVVYVGRKRRAENTFTERGRLGQKNFKHLSSSYTE